jgi:hypothetical protein
MESIPFRISRTPEPSTSGTVMCGLNIAHDKPRRDSSGGLLQFAASTGAHFSIRIGLFRVLIIRMAKNSRALRPGERHRMGTNDPSRQGRNVLEVVRTRRVCKAFAPHGCR